MKKHHENRIVSSGGMVASKSRNSLPRNRFTLVELLVVISIIAILASMLLPALNKARVKAHVIKCVGNMKQISLATFQYANDHDGWVPPLYSNNYPHALRWWGGGGNGPGASLLVDENYLPGRGANPDGTNNYRILNCPFHPGTGYSTNIFWHMGGTNSHNMATTLRRFPPNRYKQLLFGDRVTLTHERNHGEYSNWAWPDGSVSTETQLLYSVIRLGVQYFYPVYLNF